VRGGRHRRRGRACRAVGGRPFCSGPACGPSGQPVSKSRTQREADADAKCLADADAITGIVADPVTDGHTDTGSLESIDNRTEAVPLALSGPAEPYNRADFLSAPATERAGSLSAPAPQVRLAPDRPRHRAPVPVRRRRCVSG